MKSLSISGAICINIHGVLASAVHTNNTQHWAQLHNSASASKRKRSTHQGPLSSYPVSPYAPRHPLCAGVTAREWGVIPGRIRSPAPWSGPTWSWVSASASCQASQREMDDRRASAGEVSPVIDELTQRPPALRVKPVHPHHKTRHTDLRKLHDGKKGEESRNRRFVKWADVGRPLWACGVNHRVLCDSNQCKVSQQLSNQDRGVINALVESECLRRALSLSLSVLSLIVLSLRAGDSATDSSSSLLNYHD